LAAALVLAVDFTAGLVEVRTAGSAAVRTAGLVVDTAAAGTVVTAE
jgi:hypothetical protein